MEVEVIYCNLVVFVLADVYQDYIPVCSVEEFHSIARFADPN